MHMTAFRDPESRRADRPATMAQFRAQSSENEGSGVALALGGGFSRGFAHLGVLDVLEQERIPISAIVGISIGGLLGAAYADGVSVQDLCELGSKVRIRDFIRSAGSEAEGQTDDLISRFVRDWFQSSRVEQLSIPTAIVTTDLDTGAPHIFTRGPLEVAIRATCAFPGLFKHVEHEGRRLGDGCIITPVPTAIAAGMNCGFVVGVAVGSNESVVSPSRNPAQRRKIGTPEPSWVRHADVLLQPDVHDIEWYDFSRVDEARRAGADAMRRVLPLLREYLSRPPYAPTLAETSPCSENWMAP
jgi:NTE family protein